MRQFLRQINQTFKTAKKPLEICCDFLNSFAARKFCFQENLASYLNNESHFADFCSKEIIKDFFCFTMENVEKVVVHLSSAEIERTVSS